eukprot:Em0002g1034a
MDVSTKAEAGDVVMARVARLEKELAEVKEGVAVKNSNGRYVPFKALRNGTVAVSDISSGLWCELKVEYNHLHWKLKGTQEWSKMASVGNRVVLQTPEMTEGKAIHAAKDLEVHSRTTLVMETREDEWAMRLFNTYIQLLLVKEGRTEREIPVLGDPFSSGLLLSGVIDQLQYSPKEKLLTLLDFKTRVKKCLPSRAQKAATALQLMLYKSLLDQMTTGFFQVHQLRDLDLDFNMPLSSGPVDHILNSGLGSLLFRDEGWTTFGGFAKSVCLLIAGLDLPLVGPMLVHYIHQGSMETIGVEPVEYDEDEMRRHLEHSLAFWKGTRLSQGVEVEEAWKCKTCQFRDVCVWRLRRCCRVASTPLCDVTSTPLCDVNHVTNTPLCDVTSTPLCDANHVTSTPLYDVNHVTSTPLCDANHVTSTPLCDANHVTSTPLCDVNHVTSTPLCDVKHVTSTPLCDVNHVTSTPLCDMRECKRDFSPVSIPDVKDDILDELFK